MSLTPPPIKWRIRAWTVEAFNPGGAPRDTITPDAGGTLRLDALNLTPMGDSLDAALTVDPAASPLLPRDAVILDILNAAGDMWVPTYAGIVTTAPNSRATTPQTTRLTGIRQRLFETLTYQQEIGIGDVAATVTTALTQPGTLPAGLSFTAADAPTLGFTIGTRFPAYESLGDMLDALAALVPAFAVPPGQTYAYDGRTFTAGEIVPPTQWGVRADGSIFFRRTLATPYVPMTLAEGDARADIMWTPINAEDATGAILLKYMAQPNREAFDNPFYGVSGNNVLFPLPWPEDLAPPRPMARLNGLTHPELTARPATGTLHQIDGPLDFMARRTAGASITSVGVTNPNNVNDGDPATFAKLDAAPINNFITVAFPRGVKDGAWRIRYRATVTTARITVAYGFSGGGPSVFGYNWAVQYSGDVTDTQDGIRNLVLPNLLPADFKVTESPNDYLPSLTFYVANDKAGDFVEIFTIEYWLPDGDILGAASASARLAAGLTRTPAATVAQATYAGRGSLSDTIEIHPAAGAPVTVPVERITLALTPEAGITTTYHAGQAWPAAVQEQRVLLDRLARRAVQEGGRRR